jgi:hypothetical protein
MKDSGETGRRNLGQPSRKTLKFNRDQSGLQSATLTKSPRNGLRLTLDKQS